MRVVLSLALAVLMTACVSQDKFRKKTAEADQLRARSAELEASVAAKQGELAAKQAELDAAQKSALDLRAQVEDLSASKSTLESAKAELEKKSSEYEKMANALSGQIDAGRIELTELRGKMTVKMKDKILFSSGSATLGRDGKDALVAVAEVLRGVEGKVIRVEGHTDDVPLGRGAYATNWQLSVARALAVVRFLQESGVDPRRLAAAGYGEFQPIAANDTPEGRSQNRRIEIVLAPADAVEPAAPAAPSET
jgi:chemotaxis protein MotB